MSGRLDGVGQQPADVGAGIRRADLHPAVLDGVEDGTDAVVRFELAEHAGEVVLHGLFGHEQSGGNLLVGEALRGAVEDGKFPRGEREGVELAGGGLAGVDETHLGAGALGNDGAGLDGGAEEMLAGDDAVKDLEEGIDGDVTGEHGHGTGVDGFDDAGLVAEHGEEDDPGAGVLAAEDTGDLEPRDPGELAIEEDDLGTMDVGDVDGLVGATRLSDNAELVSGLHGAADAGAEHRMVVDDKHPLGDHDRYPFPSCVRAVPHAPGEPHLTDPSARVKTVKVRTGEINGQ